jgi:hypothetical protein
MQYTRNAHLAADDRQTVILTPHRLRQPRLEIVSLACLIDGMCSATEQQHHRASHGRDTDGREMPIEQEHG